MSTFVIAEIGSNHCGDLGKAKALIEIAAEAGCDAAKFQLFDVDRIWKSKRAANSRRQYELNISFLEHCAGWCENFTIEFMCTPFSPDAVWLLNPLVLRWKISSAHVWDKEMLVRVVSTRKPVLFSTGAIRPEAVTRARRRIQELNSSEDGLFQAVPLHCVSRYPALPQDYGLSAWLGRAKPAIWGVSDHSIGIGVSIAAVALGADVVEKHIALEKQPASPDDGPHALRPEGLRALVSGIRQAAAARDGSVATSKFPAGLKVWR